MLLSHNSLLLDAILVASLILRNCIYHLSVLCTLLLRVSLVTSRWISQCDGSLGIIASIDVVIAVTVVYLVTIDEYELGGMRLLDAFGERLLLGKCQRLLV